MCAVILRTVGDYHDPTFKVDDRAFLAANPMSDRQMVVFPNLRLEINMQDSLFPELTSSAGDSPARTSAWLDDVLDWLVSVADSGGNSIGSLPPSAPHGLLSRTSLDSCRPTKDGTWEPYSGRWGNSGIGGPTGSLTLSTSEFPSGAVESSLSDILESEVPQKYFLTPRACKGILRRAAKRGRELPERLKLALQQAAMTPEPTEPQADTSSPQP